jgi:ADP-heptose:LPS heptosyltransferase
MSRHLLIVHPGTLGDVLLALPAVHAVREAYSSDVVGVMAAQQIGHLLQVSGEVQAVFSTEGDALTNLLMGAHACRGTLRRFLEECDVAVGWLSDRDQRLASTFRALGVKTTVIQSPGSCGREPFHQTDRYLATIKHAAPCSAAFKGIRLPRAVTDEARLRLRELRGLDPETRPMVMLHPGSGSVHKCADPRVFEHIVHWCERRRAAPVIVCGPADEELVSRLMTMVPQVPVVRGVDLVVMAGVLSQASLFVGHDSGLTHLAAGLGLPTIALFGPTDPGRWAPRGPHLRVLRGAACACADWTQVRACHDKPCLQIVQDRLAAVCEDLLPQRNPPADQLVLTRELC